MYRLDTIAFRRFDFTAIPYVVKPVHTGDYMSPISATICRRKRRQSPFSVTVWTVQSAFLVTVTVVVLC